LVTSLISFVELLHALNTYASRLESEFVSIELPPITDDSAAIANFDLSDNYYDNLEQEFNRVYDEFTRRANTVGAVAKDIINLYAELGIPREQIDRNIIDYGSTEPERLGLTKDDIERLRTKRGKLLDERERRRNKAESFKKEIQELWAKLGIDEGDRKLFLQQNRGCDTRTLQALEEELHRLLDLKRDNLHIFVEDTRMMIAELWEKMYFGDDEVMDFSPAHSDVYTDALLTAHEMELERLENLWDERAPIISLVEKHMELMSEKEELAASAQDSSRLLSRGPRDPTRLLREEKTRKRLAKELPKIEVELKKALEDYAHAHGEPLTINGEPYLDVLMRVSPVALSRASSARTPTTTTAQPAQTPGMRGRANTISSTRDHTLQGSVRAKSRPNTKEAPMVKPPQRSKTPTARPKTPGDGYSLQRPKTPGENSSYSGSGQFVPRPKTPGEGSLYSANSSAASTLTRTTGRNLQSAMGHRPQDRFLASNGRSTPALGATPSLGRIPAAQQPMGSPTRPPRLMAAMERPGSSMMGFINRNPLGAKGRPVPSAKGMPMNLHRDTEPASQAQQYIRRKLEQDRQEEEEDVRSSRGRSIRSVSPYGSETNYSTYSSTSHASHLSRDGGVDVRSISGTSDIRSVSDVSRDDDVASAPRANIYRPNLLKKPFIHNLDPYDSSSNRGSLTSDSDRNFSSSTTTGSENWEVFEGGESEYGDVVEELTEDRYYGKRPPSRYSAEKTMRVTSEEAWESGY
jgi:protein regulator of cytokinesis 1